MMIGIRKAIKNLHPLNDDIQITENHYNMKYQFEIVTKRTAEFDYTKSSIFFEYAPMIFERIRKLYGVMNNDYLRSVGPE
jgi:1-phosphatidylinositol-4-phosphate 5-kinase